MSKSDDSLLHNLVIQTQPQTLDSNKKIITFLVGIQT